MRDKGSWSAATYRERSSATVDSGKSATDEGEQRFRRGEGLDPLVDPSKGGVVRGSNSLLVPEDDIFNLEFGVAMPVETDFDTTGSMGNNVDRAFVALPKVQNLLVQGESAVLKRYHTQIATGIIQDWEDRYPYLRSMFEPDNEVERQMSLMVPQRAGGDAPEEYQLSLLAAAHLTKATISRYGLRGYYFIVGDETGRSSLDADLLRRVFGPDVFEKAFGSKKVQSLPSTAEVAKKAVEDWHLFFLQVGTRESTTRWWQNLIGKERVILLSRTEDVAEVEASIIGLTEGVMDLQSVRDFLKSSGLERERAARVKEAVARIPVGLQKEFANFRKIPAAGSKFKSREDIWPIGTKGPAEAKPLEDSSKGKKKPGNWKL